MSTDRPKILIADSQFLTTDSLIRLIGEESKYALCGMAENRMNLIRLMSADKLDLLITDINLFDYDGPEDLKSISDNNKHFSLTKKAYSISDEESFYVAGKILNEEGILAGSSSGTLIATALKYCKEQSIPKTVVTFICDSGNKYITKMFNKFWMRDNGFTEKVNAGNLNDIITRSFLNNEIVYLRPGDSLQNAFQKMKLYDISQLPVIEGTSIVGVIDESDLLHSFVSNRDSIFSPVRNFMTTNLETLSPNDKISDVMDIFASGMVPIVVDKDTFIGLITKIDMINYLTKNKIQNEICDQNHSRRSGTR